MGSGHVLSAFAVVFPSVGQFVSRTTSVDVNRRLGGAFSRASRIPVAFADIART